MTSVHSAKEIVKCQVTEDETPAENRQFSATNENEHTLDVKGDYIAKDQGTKNHWRENSKLTGCRTPKQPTGVHDIRKPAHRNRRAT